MKIQIKRYNGGDIEDPRTGLPMRADSQALFALLNGRTVTGIGGVTQNTETITINFSDGTALWFITTDGIPRLIYQKYPL